jgi:hypothetical protein
MNVQISAQAPEFSDEWKQIRDDLANEAAGALRIGLNLIKIRDALKPLGPGLWPAALPENGMSQPQASRYIRFAEMPEYEREVYLRAEGPFSLTDAVGERRRKRASDNSSTNSRNEEKGDVEISDEQRAYRLAEIDRQRKLAVEIVEAGVKALADESQPPEYADESARWLGKLREVAAAVVAVIGEGLEAELTKRLLPGTE